MNFQNDKVADLRQDYKSDSLSMSEVNENPILQFQKWFDEALNSAILEPNVMTLATASKDGIPSARIVLLKGFDEKGFVFYTNYQSEKARQMAENPKAALVFCWLELQRQVRIEGKIELLSSEQSDKYYKSRPKGSQIGAWVSPQSTIIDSRQYLEDRVGNISSIFEGKEDIPRPPFWGGYRVVPNKIEFWQGRSSRLHDRIVYHHQDGKWQLHRVAP